MNASLKLQWFIPLKPEVKREMIVTNAVVDMCDSGPVVDKLETTTCSAGRQIRHVFRFLPAVGWRAGSTSQTGHCRDDHVSVILRVACTWSCPLRKEG